MRGLATLFSMLMLTSCGYDDFRRSPVPDFPGAAGLPNADLAVLYRSYYGDPFTVRENMVFEGSVVADDESGNFFRSFIIDDGTAAVEVRAGFYDLHNIYFRGRRIVIHAEGLAVGMYNGIVQIGIGVNDYTPYRVEEFGAKAVLEKYVERDPGRREREPVPVQIGGLDGAMCGRAVRIGRVLGVPDNPLRWAQPEDEGVEAQAGTAVFRDWRGDSITVVTSGYAAFAGGEVPRDSVTLNGILMYGKFGAGKEKFVLKLRDENDVER